MISILKKLKKSIGKTIKFYKISSDKSLLDALSFFNLRFFYSYPFLAFWGVQVLRQHRRLTAIKIVLCRFVKSVCSSFYGSDFSD